MDRSLDLWNGLFHDGVITAMAGPVPGDVTVTIQPGLGNRKFFADPGENFVVVLKGCIACELGGEGAESEPVHDLAAIWEDSSLFCVERDGAFLVFDCAVGSLRIQYATEEIFLDSGRPIRYEELEASVTRWWEEWKRYWETQRQSK